MEILNQIESSLDNKIESYKQIIAAMKVQKVWRGKLARNKHQVKVKEIQNVQSRRMADDREQKKLKEIELKNAQMKAALMIMNAYRRYQFRKNEILRIQNRNQERRQKSDLMRHQQAEVMREAYLVRKIQRWIRARAKARKEGTVAENPFMSSFKSSQKSLSPQRLNTILYKGKSTVEMQEDAICIKCKDKTAEILCEDCGPKSVYCKTCFISHHSHGTRRRHNSKQITYTSHLNDSFTKSLNSREY